MDLLCLTLLQGCEAYTPDCGVASRVQRRSRMARGSRVDNSHGGWARDDCRVWSVGL